MNHAKCLFWGALVSSAAGALSAVGCGSNSSSKPTVEAGSGNDTGTGGQSGQPDGASHSSPMCSPISGMNCPSQQGLTCCIDLTNIAGLLSGAPCVPVAQCATAVQYECLKTSDCSGQQVCCSSFAAEGGILEAGLGEAGLPEGGLGALLEGGAGGIGNLLGGININVTCQTSCSAGQQQLCAMSSECKAPGDTCQPIAIGGLPGGAAGGGGEGGAGGGLLSMLPGGGANAIMPMGCTPPDAGAPPGDSGPADAPTGD
jgi:hypothetical protein